MITDLFRGIAETDNEFTQARILLEFIRLKQGIGSKNERVMSLFSTGNDIINGVICLLRIKYIFISRVLNFSLNATFSSRIKSAECAHIAG